jgi:hypothetical protein
MKKKCGLQGGHEPTYRDDGRARKFYPRVTCDCADNLIKRLLKQNAKLKRKLK